jgi:hypothetical protein
MAHEERTERLLARFTPENAVGSGVGPSTEFLSDNIKRDQNLP